MANDICELERILYDKQPGNDGDIILSQKEYQAIQVFFEVIVESLYQKLISKN